ncbi:nudix-type nucleoside diphosphatase, YffH/AdpP family [Cnuella takakiae]|uniref:GDP-mannose pyrophosphatase n=1 Tax=Cnuella takakiae TaxID=1302690 RepID=A0A1M5EIB0_9BACT|nr:NUDIX domain-containing protein [Cnuella takakiae]OLY91181.1 hypothetical protein BUE76_04165 [Cnuella takakiae]SHF78792.1 nudix-type nucleoside diphosphatase, YffH/AdpP family [Cnuella takakiae]
MSKVSISKTEVVYDERTTLKKVTYAIEKGGKRNEQTREVVQRPNAATCLLYNPEQQVVLFTRQVRIATHVNGNEGGLLLEVPAGLLEDGEDPADTMLREILEETGYEVKGVEKLFAAYSSPGAFTELVHYFVAEYRPEQKKESGGGLEEEGEDIEIVELPFKEALQQVEQGKIQDAKTILLLQYAAMKGLLQA